jgi:hypothetical protein
MGILDDAIREHLDLKRRHGADPLEVERAEREALGPVRRAPEAPPGEESGEEDSASSFAYDQESDEDGWNRDALDEESGDDGLEFDEVEPDGDESDDPRFAADIPDFDPEPRPAKTDSEDQARRPSHHRSGDETIEYDVEDALGSQHHDADAGGTDDDVLEETPEFLQDTPDHDRLWFEQRPPKDFDFDG